MTPKGCKWAAALKLETFFLITGRKGPDDFDLLKSWLVEGLEGKKSHPPLDESPHHRLLPA